MGAEQIADLTDECSKAAVDGIIKIQLILGGISYDSGQQEKKYNINRNAWKR
jgi:hypothetical protein